MSDCAPDDFRFTVKTPRPDYHHHFVRWQPRGEYGYVYNAVKPSVRTEDLTFRHHEVVASKEEAEQRKWLKLAEEHG